MKKFSLIMLSLLILCSFVGCSNNKEQTKNNDSSKVSENTVTPIPSIKPKEETANLEGMQNYDSKFGYSFTYDASLFEAHEMDNSTTISLKNQDLEKEIPVCINITKADLTSEFMIKLIQQSKIYLKHLL